MKNLSRRQSLKLALSGLSIAGTSSLGRGLWAMKYPIAGGSPALTGKKALFVFLRGGNDGLNCVIPDDPAYYSLRIPSGVGVPKGAGIPLTAFAELHPALQPLEKPFGDGNVALLHRVHYENASRSHFSAQQFWETAKPGDLTFKEGFVTRLLELTSSDPFRGATLSPKPQRLFVSKDPNRILAHIRSFETYSLSLDPSNPTGPEGKLKRALRDHYEAGPLSTPDDLLARQTGLVMLDSEGQVEPLLTADEYDVANDFNYPDTTFGRRLKEGIQILRDTTSQIVGVELGGFDNHSNQAENDGMEGQHPDQLAQLAQGLRAIYDDSTQSGSSISDMLTIVISEFGRTTNVNASRGTDHGEASVVFAIGTGVNGGVFNCDASNWSPGDSVEIESRYVGIRTDYREVLAEALRKHFGLASSTALNTVIPDYTTISVGDPLFDELGYLL